MNNQPLIDRHSPAWIFQAWVAFTISLSLTLGGIYFAPVDLWVKGYFAMGLLFTIGSTFSLAKTIRDNFEADKVANRIASAKTEKILHDYEFRDTLHVAK